MLSHLKNLKFRMFSLTRALLLTFLLTALFYVAGVLFCTFSLTHAQILVGQIIDKFSDNLSDEK